MVWWGAKPLALDWQTGTFLITSDLGIPMTSYTVIPNTSHVFDEAYCSKHCLLSLRHSYGCWHSVILNVDIRYRIKKTVSNNINELGVMLQTLR